MTLSIESRIDGRKVRFEAGGPWNLPEAFALIERAREEADAAGLPRGLIDMRGATGPIWYSEETRANLKKITIGS
jgi:hypothetical protein